MMSKRTIRLRVKGTNTNPVPPPVPKILATQTVEVTEQDNTQQDEETEKAIVSL